jgi:hypothetical protein
MRVGDVLQFENFRTAETSDDECFHGESLSVLQRDRRLAGLAGRGRTALHHRGCGGSRSPVSASIMMVEFPIPAA